MTHLQSSKKFVDIEFADNAKTSAIKCVHISSGFACDLNFQNTINVFKSSILGHLLMFDKRIYKLAVILKYWMKVHNIIGTDGISSYDALWLVMFYLQQLREPVLPPIDTFQNSVPSFYIEQTNLAFNFSLPNIVCNHQGSDGLLLGFFAFYTKFDFDGKLICPLMGRAFGRSEFKAMFPEYFIFQGADMPMDFGKPICIQDPFERRRSIPERVTMNLFMMMRKAMVDAAEICRQKLCDASNCGEGLLYALFTHGKSSRLDKDESSFTIAVHQEYNGDTNPKPITQLSTVKTEIGGTLFNNSEFRPSPTDTFQPPINLEMIIVNGANDKIYSMQLNSSNYEMEMVQEYLKMLKPIELKASPDKIDRIWAQFSIHFVSEILDRILQLEAVNAEWKFQKKNALACTFNVSSMDLTCHLWVNQSEHTSVVVDFHGNMGNEQVDQKKRTFLDRLHKTHLPSIVSQYFSNILDYQLVNPAVGVRRSRRSPDASAIYNLGITYSMVLNINNRIEKCLQKLLRKWNFPLNYDDGLKVRRVWASYCLQFVIDILSNILAFELTEYQATNDFPNNSFSKSFEAIATRNVTYKRTKMRKLIPRKISDVVNVECATTSKCLSRDRREAKSTRAIFHIWSNQEICDKVTIDVINLEQTSMGNAWSQTKGKIPKLVEAYFTKLCNNKLILNYVSNVAENVDGERSVEKNIAQSTIIKIEAEHEVGYGGNVSTKSRLGNVVAARETPIDPICNHK